MSPRRKPSDILRLLICLALVSVLALASGCGFSTLASDTAKYVGETFSSKGDSLRKRMVALPFTSGVEGLKPKADEIYGQLVAKLGEMDNIHLVDPSRLTDAEAMVPKEITDPEERLVLAARKLGLNVVLRAQITDLSVTHRLTGIYGMRENTPFLNLELDMALVDVISGAFFDVGSIKSNLEIDEVKAQAVAMGAKPDPKKVDELVKELTEPSMEWVEEKLEDHKWSGLVLAVEGNRLLLTVARDTGLNQGDLLAVQALGEKIKSGSGRMVYLPGKLIGKVRLMELGQDTSWAEVVPPEVVEKPEPEKLSDEKLEGEKMGDEAKAKPEPEPKLEPEPVVYEPGQVVRPL